MQYGHCVVRATATAISSLYLSGIAPSLKAASSNATNPFQASGASSPNFLSLARFFMSYIVDPPGKGNAKKEGEVVYPWGSLSILRGLSIWDDTAVHCSVVGARTGSF